MEKDYSYKSEYLLSCDSLTVINTLDEDPLYIDKNRKYFQYQHGNVNTRSNEFSVGFVFRNVSNIREYDSNNSVMIHPNNSIGDIVHNKIGYDLDAFHRNLINLYHNVIF